MIAVAMANYNHKCSLKKYPLAPEMMKDGLVDPSPIEVWNWGMKIEQDYFGQVISQISKN